ncbi:wyosine base formation domain-containing protein [Wenjunlia vitaminophila]|uniref:Wyosine base formation domain-containing protein n=1 Tax=Wenjunlia vitaminophila TaxID=76728 RepID=A0A0T6LQ44_WENVI|nr:TIGR03084 family metal-binding protein [Wenjunlia vitaminophila]KRV48205.1 wyosine base formation domain-containing protein [Wenjunlia vitaminophila]
MADPTAVLDDLTAEGDELDALVAPLAPASWALTTPSPGWTVAHQIAHLAWTDEVTLLALTDPDGFRARAEHDLRRSRTFVDDAANDGAREHPAALLRRWRQSRTAVDRALRTASPGTRVPWYGPPMSVASVATARLMETWAHGQDVADALGRRRTATARLRQVARIGWRTRDYAYLVRGASPPSEPFRIELTAPDGSLWAFGPQDAGQRVTGPALDFCLLVTQRRHRADLAVTAHGRDADRWLDIAQAFAGPPGGGRPPGPVGVGDHAAGPREDRGQAPERAG